MPIAVLPVVATDSGIEIIRKRDRITISDANSVHAIWAILAKCDGVTDAAEIVNELQSKMDVESDVVEAIMRDLSRLGVLCDSREQYKRFHDISSYPTPYIRNLTKSEINDWCEQPQVSSRLGKVFDVRDDGINSLLEQLQLQRSSVRSYTDRSLSLEQVGRICQLGYGLKNRTVPSGGGLYPLRIFLVVMRSSNDLPCGYYEYDPYKNSLVLYSDIDPEAINYANDASKRLFNAPVQVVIVANLQRQAYKYANRGYRLTLIEAGQVAQNMTLAAIEMGLGSCELGGVVDDVLSEELHLSQHEVPVLSLAVGYVSLDKWTDDNSLLDEMYDEPNLTSKIVKNLYSYDYLEIKQWCAIAEIEGDSHNVACGVATSCAGAQIKAIAEACERYASEHPRIDFVGSASQIGCSWADPRVFVPLTKLQLKAMGLTPFQGDSILQWTAGRDWRGNAVMIPSDLVYYGYHSEIGHISAANSSGVAAHTSIDDAAMRALLELIERDALMCMWFKHCSPIKLSVDCMPTHIKRQFKYWSDNNRRVYFLVPESTYAPVALVAIVGETYPYFVSGAAASATFEEAFKKAFSEAEISIASQLSHPDTRQIECNQVRTPSDHGRFYAATNRNDILEWMWRGEDHADYPCGDEFCWQDVLRKVDGIIVDISLSNLPVKVVRVLSRKLIPISFGYQCDFFTHRGLPRRVLSESQLLPHFFA